MVNTFLALLITYAFAGDLTLKQIMDDPHWIGELPSRIHLSEEDGAVYFQVSQPIPQNGKAMRYDLQTKTLSEVTAEKRAFSQERTVHRHGKYSVHQVGGDLWVSRNGGALEPLFITKSRTRFGKFVGEHSFIYAVDNNFFLYALDTGKIQQLTDLALRSKPKNKEDFYHLEERKMFEYVDHMYQREEMEPSKDFGAVQLPKTTYLGKVELNDTHISDDLQYVALSFGFDSEQPDTYYPEFIDQDPDVALKKARPKVASLSTSDTFSILDRATNEVTEIDFSDLPEITTDRLAEVKAEQSEEDKKLQPKHAEGPRPFYIMGKGFRPNGHEYLLVVASVDSKDRWLVLVDAKTKKWELIKHEYDPAWILIFSRNFGFDNRVRTPAWSDKGQKVAFLSEETGYGHLYTYDMKTKETKLTHKKGAFEIYSPFESEDGKFWYFHANIDHPGVLDFYRMAKKNGKMTKLSEGVGQHQVSISRDGHTMVETFSQANRPPVIRVKHGKKAAWETIYDGTSETFKAYPWTTGDLISYTNRDGKEVYARLYKPEKPNGAAVIFVHGAGYLQNAHKGWSGYFREYMFHHLLMAQGYTVLDPDYQASAGYGRDWRTAIYRHMGGKDLNDIVDGAAFLSKTHGVDAKRIGVYGGSYGGFMALMAMFTTPDVFQAGAALRPVTDWAYYNHLYTARILNTPQTDPAAYRKSSPIYFADGLKGNLLICHGMIDDNVHYQDSVRLAQKLIELRKHNWELSSYPVEPHGFKTPSGWYDEYRRIYELFERTLK